MFSNIGATGVILIVLVALLLFGPNKLPELGRAFGRTLREFKEGARDIMSDEDKQRKELHPEEVKVQETKAEQPKTEHSQENKRLPE